MILYNFTGEYHNYSVIYMYIYITISRIRLDYISRNRLF